MIQPISLAIEHLRQGRMIILVDDADRENEGDLVLAAQFATAEAVNFMAMHGRGLICLSLDQKRANHLGLTLMPAKNEPRLRTAFTYSIEAAEGVSTGISAQDRARTIQAAINPLNGSEALVSPGHIFPLIAKEGGALVRAGHTEASVDLARLGGLLPSAVICEIMNPDGTMARMPDLMKFAENHGLDIFTIKDLIAHRLKHESLVEHIAESVLPTDYGLFKIRAFRSKIDQAEHVALIYGDIGPEALVRVHSECLTGDVFSSLRCDCGGQLKKAMAAIAEEGSGVLIYLRNQEGRGIGLANKINAYAMQDGGLDTVEANIALGFKADLRDYGIGAQILKALGVERLRLLTNNPKKIIGLEGYGLMISEVVPLVTPSNVHNQCYLHTKQNKMEHKLSF